MKKRKWTKYKVNNSFGSREPLDKIYHICHTRNALNIASDGKIKAGLVYDKSKLNLERTLVCWLSPNEWVNGYRYGNIRFEFEWKEICNEMNYYWVEVMEDYQPHALRILLSDQEHSDKLKTYNPKSGDGPWYYDKKEDQHYWNGKYCLEIMVERDLPMSEVVKIDFVNHHPRYCCLPGNCDEIGSPWHWAGSSFIAGIVGQNIKHRLPKFYEMVDDEIEIDYCFEQSCKTIKNYLEDIDKFKGRINSKQKVSLPLARAILNAYAFNDDDIEPLAALFKSRKSLIKSCAKLIAEKFKIDDWKDIFPKPRRR